MPSDIRQSTVGEELPEEITKSTVAVACEHVEKILHRARRGKFKFSADEPPRLGGDNKHPSPLTYIAAGVGF